MTVASVLVPTHSSAETLDISVASALAQTVTDIEVVLIGDGVTAELRAVARSLAEQDARVRFLDLPKGEHHGERHRDSVVRDCDSPIVCYLCDDDLLLPDHVASMAELLETADFANSLNGHITPDGAFEPYMSDLASESHRAWLMHPNRNSVSVTGTAHTVASYRRLPDGWEPPPPGRWTDHVMWQKLLGLPDIRAVTSRRVTALQLPSHLADRSQWAPEQRRAELERWWDLIRSPDGARILDDVVRVGLNRKGALLQDAHFHQLDRIAELEDELAEQMARMDAARHAGEELRRDLEEQRRITTDLAERLAQIEGSRTWRLRGALVRGPLERLVRR